MPVHGTGCTEWAPTRSDCQLTAQYDAIARVWHDRIARLGYPGAYDALIARGAPTILRIQSSRNLSVLDAGTGTGAFALAFMRWQRHALPQANVALDVLDPSPAMLEQALGNLARHDCPAIGMCNYIQSLKQKPRSYDVILCSHVIEHSATPLAELSALAAALKPGGVLYLIASRPGFLTWLLQRRWHHKALGAPEIGALLNKVGLDCIEINSLANLMPRLTSQGYIMVKPSPRQAS